MDSGDFKNVEIELADDIKSKTAMEDKPATKPRKLKLSLPPCRYIFAAMGFFAILNVYSLRVNISVAIVDMVNATYQHDMEAAKKAKLNTSANSSHVSPVSCAAVAAVNSTATPKEDGPFKWDSSQQLLVTGSYFYGYIATQFVAGMIAQRFGGKFVLLTGIGMTSLLTIISPACTMAGGLPAIVVLRVLEGFFSGVAFPSMNSILSNWAPPMERTLLASFIFAGAQIGTLIGMSLTGVLGWQGAFYFFGCLGLIWCVMWFFLTYDSPSVHPRITAEEKEYIENSLGKKEKRSLHVPWLDLLKCPPFYALAVAHFTNLWGYYTLLNALPLYFKNIMFFDIKKNGALSGAPYIVMWVVMLLSGWAVDQLRSRKLLSTTNVRKLCFSFGFIVPAACLVAVGFVNCHQSGLAVALIIIAVGAIGPAYSAWNVNPIDLAPPYSGTMIGITNTIGTIPGFTGTLVVSGFTTGNQTVEAWRNVFYVTAGIHVFGTIVYCIFGSGELQPWAKKVKPPPEVPVGEIEANATETKAEPRDEPVGEEQVDDASETNV